MVQDIKDVVTWLQNWFSVTSDVVLKSQGSGNASKNVVTDSSGDVTLENKVSCGTGLSFDGSVGNKINHSNSITAQTSTVFKKFKYDAQGHITGTGNVQSSDLPSHTHNSTQITDSNTYSYFTPSDDTQSEINKAIDSAIGSLSSINAIEVVTTKPTASASTMGKLYIVSENSKVNVYYTEKTGSGSSATYSWHKMDTDILDELSISWNDVTGKPTFATVATSGSYSDLSNKPSIPTDIGDLTDSGGVIPTDVSDLTDTQNTTFTPKSHTHGSITNDGKITNATLTPNASDYILISEHDTDEILCSPYILSSLIKDPNAHSNIGSSANDTQGAINTSIDTALGNKASSSHTHGQVTNDGKITSTAVTVASGDNIVITDASDSSKVKRVANLLADHIKDGTAHSNIGSSANDTQATINSDIDTALGNKASSTHTHSQYVTSIALMPKGSDPTSDNYNGVIRLYYGDEPS